MIFHENRLLADDSHEISFLISFENEDLSSVAVVIGALRVKILLVPDLYVFVPMKLKLAGWGGGRGGGGGGSCCYFH